MDAANLLIFIAGLTGHTWLIVLLVKRGIRRYYPFFLVYQVFCGLATGARLAVIARYDWYFFIFWGTELGFLLLGVIALHEVFRREFSGFYLLRWFRWLYYGGIAAALLIAVANSILNPPVKIHPVVGAILGVGIAINCVQAAIFGSFYLFVKLLDVRFRRYAFGIALGFGIASIGTLIPYVARSEFGTSFQNAIIYVPSVAYIVSLIVWLSAFWKAEPEQDQWTPPMPPEQMAEEARQYVRILRSFFGRRNED